MDDAELRGLIEQVKEDVQGVRDIADDVRRQLSEHRLTVGAVVGDLNLKLALLANHVDTLALAVTTSVEEGRESTQGVKDLVSEMKQARSQSEWQTALDKANAPKRLLGRTPEQLAIIIAILALLIVAAVTGVKIPSLGSLFGV